jgi:ABC-type glycerol-3-phosphate transport system substrate-binding protein
MELWKEDKWTWEVLADSLGKIAKRAGDGWEVAGISPGLHRLWMNAAGGKEFDDIKAPKRCQYDDPGSVEALTFLQDLRHKYRVTPVDFSREVGMNDTDAFVAGKVAMMARWTTGVGVYKNVRDFKWGMVPYPKRKTYANDFATSGPAIAKDSKALAASWEWVKFREGPDGTVPHAADGTTVYFHQEARKVAQETHRSIATLETPTAMVDMLEGAKHNFVRLLSVDQAKMHSELINPELNKAWRNEEAAASVARRVAAAVNEFLKTNPQ